MIRLFLTVVITLLVIGLNGCTDSDQYLFKPESSKNVEVQAYITRSFEQESEKTKLDTIVPGDSLIFFTSIYPSKSIRLQRYYWNMDGKFFANEFSFKNTVTEPGIHKIEFILIDYFGDLISDSLTLYVGAPPTLDDKDYIPKENTQGVNPSNLVNFVWTNLENDALWQVFYRFTLKKFGDSIPMVDTLLTDPQFTYYAGLEPQEKYLWSVVAANELNMFSDKAIHATFYTEGYGKQGAIFGHVEFDSVQPSSTVSFTLQDKESQVVQTFKNYSLKDNGAFYLTSVPSGTYLLTCSVDSLPDFKPSTDTVTITSKGIANAYFALADEIGPKIYSIDHSDTLNASDSLRFIIRDGGGELKLSRISVQLEETHLSGLQYRGDTLIVPLSLENSWTVKRLKIAAQDFSGNKVHANFYIRPETSYEEVAGD